MVQADPALTTLIEEATSLLSTTQDSLQTLSQRLTQYLAGSADDGQNGRQAAVSGLQYIYDQTQLLLKQSIPLKTLLSNNFEGVITPPTPLSIVQLLQRQEEDRSRTARDLEDLNGQLLANAIFELAAVKKLLTTPDTLDQVLTGLTALQQELEQGLTNLRLLIADLEPNTVLGNFGLVAGLRRYLEKFAENTGLATELHVQTVIEPLPGIIEIAIFRIIQEALQNIRRHATANKVQIFVEEENSRLKFTVTDNGTGFSPHRIAPVPRRLGLVSIKELADMLDGKLQIKTEPNKGTQVILTIPYPKF